MVIVTVTMVSTATMAPVIQDGLAPITYTALKISSAIPTCKSVGRGYEGALTNNSAGQEASARLGCVQSKSAVCTKTALVTTLANRESVRSTRVTVMRDTTTIANTDMLASTVGVFFVQAANFNFYLRCKGVMSQYHWQPTDMVRVLITGVRLKLMVSYF